MTAPVQSCGTCRWWTRKHSSKLGRIGQCDAPIPQCAVDDRRQIMFRDEGTTCPCYAPREGGEETR